MTASVATLIFVGLLLAALGVFAGGNILMIGLGVVALIAAAAFESASSKRA